MKQKYSVSHEGKTLTFSQSEFESFSKEFETLVAAGGLVVNSENEILLMHRLGHWDLPKGKMEKGETEQVSAVREVQEETGIKEVRLREKLVDTYHTYELNGKKILKRTAWFLMTVPGKPELTPQTEEGITEVLWLSQELMEVYLENSYPSIHLVWEAFLK
jgi:8-oxo-dGTP pyrophosphatase MutT (NUDIX family)